MHLFYQSNAENLPSSEHLDPAKNEKGLEARLEARRRDWFTFFEKNQNGAFNFFDPTLDVFASYFRKNELIQFQTAHQKNLSQEFYRWLFDSNKKRQLFGGLAALRLLHLSVLFGCYSGLFKSDARQRMEKLPQRIIHEYVSELFVELLVRYPDACNFLNQWHLLNSLETSVHMSFLAGEKVRGRKFAGQYFNAKKMNQILRFSTDNLQHRYPDNHVFLRNWIVLQMTDLLPNQDLVIDILKTNHTFLYDPEKFLKHMDYWKIAIPLLGFSNLCRPYNEYMDFIEYNLYREFGRVDITHWNEDVLEFSAEIWYDGLNLLESVEKKQDELKWSPMKNLFEFTFEVDRKRYAAVQLTTGLELREEGDEMDNCVLTYIKNCVDGHISIWSIREKKPKKDRKLLTVEVNKYDEIVQVVRKANNPIQLRQYEIIKKFAQQRDFVISVKRPER